jgi:hypothetical protein
MFANCMLGGMNFGFPDVCLTMLGPPPPVPIPYPNFSLNPIGVPFAPNVLFMGGPAHFLATIVPVSFGDLPGIMGVISGTIMGPTFRLTCAPNVLVDGIPSVRFTDMTLQNTINTIGATIVPSQVKVLIL